MFLISQDEHISTDYINNNNVFIKYLNNKYYLGNICNNIIEGYGKFFNHEYIYHGHWNNNLPNGNGILIDKKKKLKYKAFFKNGKLHNYGIIYYDNNYIFEGEFNEGMKHGYGKVLYNNNIIYKGIWYNDEVVNNEELKTIFTKNGIKKYECTNIDFKNNNYIINGEVKEYKLINDNLYLIYDGEILDNKYEGYGILYTVLNNKYYKLYEGIFENNKFNDRGILFNSDGSVYYNGKFNNGYIDDTDITILDITNKNKFKYTGSVKKIEYKNDDYYPYKIIFDKGSFYDFNSNFIINGIWNSSNILDLLECSIYLINKIHDFKILDSTNIFCGKNINSELNYFEGEYNNKDIKFKGKIKLDLNNQNNIHYISGKLYKNNIIVNEGHYNNNNNLNGLGIYYKNGIKRFEGYFINGILNRTGKSYYISNPLEQIEYDGDFYKGYRHGYGKLYTIDGSLVFNGRFNYNEPVN